MAANRGVSEAIARAIAMRRYVTLCSSDEDEDEDEAAPPAHGDDFRRNARQALDELLDF